MQIIYEAYGPSATGYIVECLTDNLNRTASQVRSVMLRGGGKMAEKGSVAFNFARRGQLVVPDCSLEEQVQPYVCAGCSDERAMHKSFIE